MLKCYSPYIVENIKLNNTILTSFVFEIASVHPEKKKKKIKVHRIVKTKILSS